MLLVACPDNLNFHSWKQTSHKKIDKIFVNSPADFFFLFFFFKQIFIITQQHRGLGLSIRAVETVGIKISHFSSFKSVSGAFPTIYSAGTGMHGAVGKTTESWCIWEGWELVFPSDLLLHPAQSMARDPNRSMRMKTLNKDGAAKRGRGMETLHLGCHCYKESNPWMRIQSLAKK